MLPSAESGFRAGIAGKLSCNAQLANRLKLGGPRPIMPPMSKRILVIDDDSWMLGMITAVLEDRGFTVSTASDGREGLAKATKEHPELVITDVVMPNMDGWQLVRELRAMRMFAFVPVILLTQLDSRRDRLQGFRLGADDYLAKPFRLEELVARVERALERRFEGRPTPGWWRREVHGEEPEEEPALQGSLKAVGPASLLNLLASDKATGVLELRRGEDGPSARIDVRDGELVRAQLRHGRRVRHHGDAILELLRWPEGRFIFRARPVEGVQEVTVPLMQLLLEAARRLDEEG